MKKDVLSNYFINGSWDKTKQEPASEDEGHQLKSLKFVVDLSRFFVSPNYISRKVTLQ